jgi:predicted  nucleic acid-binding Zn-ribbon protein
MVHQVDVDGEIHEFPDEATPEMMQAALKTEATRQQFTNLTQHGILDRPREKLMSDALGLAKNIGSTVKEGVPALLNQAVSSPGKSAKNIGAGLSSIPFNIGNAILNTPQYIAGLESDRASKFLKKYTPEIPTEGIVNATFGEPSQADTDVRNLGALLPILGPLGKAGGKGATSAIKGGVAKVVGKTDPLLEANEALLDTNLDQKAAELEQKTAAAQAAEDANKQAIAQSKQEVGKSDADLMQYNVTNRQKAIDELTQKNAALKDQLSQVQPKEGAVGEAQSKVLAKQEAQLKALQETEANDAAYSSAIEQSKQQTGKSNPDLMENAATKRQQDIDNMMNEASALQEQLTNIKVGEDAIPQAEENLNVAQLHQQNTENMADSVESNIGQFLNQGAAHAVRAGQGLSHRVRGIEDYWNNAYKTFQSNIADANFQMPKTAMEKLDYDTMSPTQLIKTFGADAFEALKKGKLDDFIKKQKSNDVKQAQGSNSYLQTLMEVAPTITDTNAADFLAKYKDFRDRTFKLSQRLRDPRVEEVEKQKMQEALTQARQMQAQMKQVLDAGLGKFKPEFERVNKGYSEQIYPLRDNPVVQNAHEGKLSDNIIKSLRTNEEGMPLVRELVKQDPEILRNVIGQRYFAKPEELHNPTELMREYLGEVPQLQRLLNEKQTANAALEQSRTNANVAQQQHADLVKRQAQSEKLETNLGELHDKIKGSSKELKTLEKHISSLRDAAKKKGISLEKKVQIEKQLSDAKAEHAELQKNQSEAEKIEKKITDLTDGIEKHAAEIPKLKAHITNLQETAQRKNITLKEKMKSEQELKELRRQLKDTSSKLDEKVTGLRKYWRIAKTIYKIRKKMII